MQHGGKDIPQCQIPGLKLIMNLCGIENSFCMQHDLHHTRQKCNFSLTGIYDKIFGTYVTNGAKKNKSHKYYKYTVGRGSSTHHPAPTPYRPTDKPPKSTVDILYTKKQEPQILLIGSILQW